MRENVETNCFHVLGLLVHLLGISVGEELVAVGGEEPFKRMSAIFISMFDGVQLKKVHGSKGCLQHLLMMMAIPRICSKVYAKSIIGHDIEYLAF